MKVFAGDINGSERRERERERERPSTIAKRGFLSLGLISVLLILFAGEACLQKVMLVHNWSTQHLSNVVDQFACQDGYLQLDRFWSSVPGKLHLLTRPTVQEAYETRVTNLSNVTRERPRRPIRPKFQTAFEPNRNVNQYGLTAVRNACMRPDGPIVMVGLSGEDILKQVSEVPALQQDWFSSYNASQDWGGMGYELMDSDSVPKDAHWVPGTTTHIIPYLGNVFHHFADRLWPHIAGFQPPLNETTAHPINHFLVHRFSTWLFQAGHNIDRNTLMYQIRILGALAPSADFLVMDGLEQQALVCYERLVLACTVCDRMGDWLGYDITTPALLRYRHATLTHFGLSEPAMPLPPRRLRVTFYGRGDAKRRRIKNAEEVVNHLNSYTSPPLTVTFVDELLADGEYNQSFPEVVSLFSQTDIFITVHGANTWAALFMPKYSGVIEIEGPCGPSTWLNLIAKAVDLKHDRSNPWGEAVPTPDAGNVTECDGPYKTPDFTVDLRKLDVAILGLALPTFGFDDVIPRHWLYKWA